MGLDMYLTKKTYVGAYFEHRNVKGKISITVLGKPLDIKLNRVSEISERLGEWRKANAVHHWFVVNCQDGEDDCRDAEVSKEKLKELLSICQTTKADNNKANLLPPKGGFFFGSTVIDAGYFQDIDDTIKILEDALLEDSSASDIYYHSSW